MNLKIFEGLQDSGDVGELYKEKIKPGERVLGVVPDELRRLIALGFDAYNVLQAQAATAGDAELFTLMAEIEKQTIRIEAIKVVFWAELSMIYGKNLGIREGWNVVQLPAPQPRRVQFDVVITRGCGDPHCPDCGGEESGLSDAEAQAFGAWQLHHGQS